MNGLIDDDLEPRLRALFDAQAAAVRSTVPTWRAQSDDIVVVVSELAPARAPRPRVRIAVVALVTVAIAGLGVVAAVMPPGALRTAGSGAGASVHWTTPQVDLQADDFSITVDGVQYTAAGAAVDVHSDPGDPSYQTLELVWQEHGREMRWFIYFASCANQWWSNEMRTYNGKAAGDWVTFHGDFFRRALGSTYSGDLDVTATEGGVTSHLVAHGLRLQAFITSGPANPTPPTTALPGATCAPANPVGTPTST